MGADISEGAKIAIILIILCAVIAIVFSLLTMMKNVAAAGSQSLQNGMDQLSDSEFQNYDQKTVSGTDVAAAVKIFEGRPIAFVTVTGADVKKAGANATSWTGHLYGAYLGKTTGAGTEKVGNAGTAAGTNAGTTWEVTVEHATGAEPSEYTGAGITKYEGNAYYTGTLYTNAAGSTEYNMNVRPMSVTGKVTFVRSSAKFLSELIKDTTGSKIGACFMQLN